MKWEINGLPLPDHDNTEAWAWLMATHSDALDNVPDAMSAEAWARIRARADEIDPGHAWWQALDEQEAQVREQAVMASMPKPRPARRGISEAWLDRQGQLAKIKEQYEALGRQIEALEALEDAADDAPGASRL